jgi:hypothetical protein
LTYPDDEGKWFDCHLDRARRVDTCRIWKHDGSYFGGGDFVLEDERRPATEAELRPTHAFRDEQGRVFMIYLQGDLATPQRTLVRPGFRATVN